ncbi:unnamed protein product [Polarella glacialis]|uniref:Uncharacterized protein n=1 Tax=Polarella glacialis TaxID=89957 RepID=A0A813LJQ4_POLGL|nr:unnamed protein product [Polarella glacialis]
MDIDRVDDGGDAEHRRELRLLGVGLTSLADVPGLGSAESKRLRTLHLHGNALASVRGLDAACPNLEELVLSSNELRSLEGISSLQRLRTLDLSCNCLCSLQGVERLAFLEELHAAYNQIGSLAELAPLRGAGSKLRVLDLRDNILSELGELLYLGGLVALDDLRLQASDGRRANPVCRLPGFRAAVLCASPDLTSLDEKAVDEAERSRCRESPPAAAAGGSAVELPRHWPKRRVVEVPLAVPGPQVAELPEEDSEELSQVGEESLLEILAELRGLCRQRAVEASVAAERRAAIAESVQRAAKASPIARVPKIGHQLQHELQLVAAEARRRQVLDAKLQDQLAVATSELSDCEAGTRALRDEVRSQRHAAEKLLAATRRHVQEASSAADAAHRAQELHSAEAGKAREERFTAEELLLQQQAKTDSLAALQVECRTESARERTKAAEVSSVRLELASLETQLLELDVALGLATSGAELWTARSAAEAAACQTAVTEEQASAASVSASVAEEQKAAAEEALAGDVAEQRAEDLARQLADLRREVEEETEADSKSMEELLQLRAYKATALELEEKAMERQFSRRLTNLAAEARRLQDRNLEVAAASIEQEQVLEHRSRAANESRHAATRLEGELVAAKTATLRCQDELSSATQLLQQSWAQAQDWQASQRRAQHELCHLQAELQTEFVSAALHQEQSEHLQLLQLQRSEVFEAVQRFAGELEEASSSMHAQDSPDRLRGILGESEVRVAAVVSEFQSADGDMDGLRLELQSFQDKASEEREAQEKRQSRWRRAESEVEARMQHATEEEGSAEDLEAALQEELLELEQASGQYDEELLSLQLQVDEVRSQWAESDRREKAELEVVRGEGMQAAKEAEAQLTKLGAGLGKELRRHAEANVALEAELREAKLQLADFRSQEKALQESWQAERQRQAKEAAALAAELQRLAATDDG